MFVDSFLHRYDDSLHFFVFRLPESFRRRVCPPSSADAYCFITPRTGCSFPPSWRSNRRTMERRVSAWKRQAIECKIAVINFAAYPGKTTLAEDGSGDDPWDRSPDDCEPVNRDITLEQILHWVNLNESRSEAVVNLWYIHIERREQPCVSMEWARSLETNVCLGVCEREKNEVHANAL